MSDDEDPCPMTKIHVRCPVVSLMAASAPSSPSSPSSSRVASSPPPAPLPSPLPPPFPLSSPPSRHSRNLHVDNLVRVTEATLRSLFAPFGKILRVRVVSDELGHHSGYGFVMFDREEEARRAMEAMDHVLVFSDFRVDVTQLHSHSPSSKQQPSPHQMASLNNAQAALDQKHEHSTALSSPRSSSREGECNSTPSVDRIRNSTTSEGSTALSNTPFVPPKDSVLNEDGTITLASGLLLDMRGHIGKRLRVSMARQKNAPCVPPVSPTVNTNLYIAGLAPHYSKQRLDALFAPYGRILDSRILLDRATGNSRGVGFVLFDNQMSCQMAIHSWNGRRPDDSTQPITVRYAAVDRPTFGSVNNVIPISHLPSQPSASVDNVSRHPSIPQSSLLYNPYDMSNFVTSLMPSAPLSPLSPMPLSHSPPSLSSFLNFDVYPPFLPPLSPLPLSYSPSPPQSPGGAAAAHAPIMYGISPSTSPLSPHRTLHVSKVVSYPEMMPYSQITELFDQPQPLHYRDFRAHPVTHSSHAPLPAYQRHMDRTKG